jgi:hypothetical protein
MRAVILVGLLALSSCSLLFNGDDLHGHPGSDLGVDDLSGLDLSGADLTAVDLYGADLAGKALSFDVPQVGLGFNGASNIVALGLGKANDTDATLSLFLADPSGLTASAYAMGTNQFMASGGTPVNPCVSSGNSGTLYDAGFGDVDNDNYFDVVTLCGFGSKTAVEIFYGVGMLPASATTEVTVGLNARFGPMLGDFIFATGNLDLAVSAPSYGQVEIYVHSGPRTYSNSPVIATVAGTPARGDVHRVNSDAVDDFVVAQTVGTGTFTATGFYGGSTLTPWATFPTSAAPIAARIGKLDQLDLPDVVVLMPDGIAAFLGHASSAGAVAPQMVGAGNQDLALADFDGDGVLDLALATQMAPGDTLLVALGKGDGTFDLPPKYSTPVASVMTVSANVRLAVADVDGDMRPDVVMGTSTGAIYYFHNSTH